MSYKLDLFKLLEEITKGNTKYYQTLSEDQQKEFQPFVIQKWLSGAKDNNDYHTVLTDHHCNQYVFDMGKQKNLLYKLLCVANGFGYTTRFEFPKNPKKSSKQKNTVQLLMDHYGYREDQAIDALRILDVEYILQIAGEHGYDSKQLKAVKDELS